jgi:hypothetical protein
LSEKNLPISLLRIALEVDPLWPVIVGVFIVAVLAE